MSKVILIGTAKKSSQNLTSANSVDAIKGKGLLGDRKFKDKNHKKALTI